MYPLTLDLVRAESAWITPPSERLVACHWCDDHAGVSADVWEACYQLGVNVLFYAHAEHAKWLEAKKK